MVIQQEKIKVIAAYPLSNFGGIEIIDINTSDDEVKWRTSFGTPGIVRTSELQYSMENEMYDGETDDDCLEFIDGFMADEVQVNLSECIRLNM